MSTIAQLRPSVGKRYMELFDEFPVRPIRNDKELEVAGRIMDRLAIRNEAELTRDEQDYLYTITLLVEAYEDAHHRIDTSKLTPAEITKFLMEQRDMSAADLAKVLGSKAAASYVINGTRNPSRMQCVLLGRHFHVEPSLFFAEEAVPRVKQGGSPGKRPGRRISDEFAEQR
jgi:antitoxin component HigA of HigAB toxin-antitoxin module